MLRVAWVRSVQTRCSDVPSQRWCAEKVVQERCGQGDADGVASSQQSGSEITTRTHPIIGESTPYRRTAAPIAYRLRVAICSCPGIKENGFLDIPPHNPLELIPEVE